MFHLFLRSLTRDNTETLGFDVLTVRSAEQCMFAVRRGVFKRVCAHNTVRLKPFKRQLERNFCLNKTLFIETIRYATITLLFHLSDSKLWTYTIYEKGSQVSKLRLLFSNSVSRQVSKISCKSFPRGGKVVKAAYQRPRFPHIFFWRAELPATRRTKYKNT